VVIGARLAEQVGADAYAHGRLDLCRGTASLHIWPDVLTKS
jgi:hypothetical protein